MAVGGANGRADAAGSSASSSDSPTGSGSLSDGWWIMLIIVVVLMLAVGACFAVACRRGQKPADAVKVVSEATEEHANTAPIVAPNAPAASDAPGGSGTAGRHAHDFNDDDLDEESL
jgi:hypothetical protein